ncbi:hypothetical protein AGDE_09893 [Angomonas deanei]|nr:hypothetical protein AGDE_09893 [Angomonas deanei]|eukprot:EPY29718.1 hypothetical protein AGDE_09893 [Angomonas deanei]
MKSSNWLCVTALLLLMQWTVVVSLRDLDPSAEVYFKLHPGKEFCLAYEALRDPESDPATVAFYYRIKDPRLLNIKTTLYSPSPNGERKTRTSVDLKLSSLSGDIRQAFFEARETGTYYVCMRIPLMQPIIRVTAGFQASNDVVPAREADDGALVIDKPPEIEDYTDRISFLETALKGIVDETRRFEARHSLVDDTINSALYLLIGSTVVNVIIIFIIFAFSEKLLERAFMKDKIA